MQEIIYWEWEEAFSKFGFEDGDGWNGTCLIHDFLRSLGYEVDSDNWGIHNYMIQSIQTKKGKELMDWDKNTIGYDSPRNYLPKRLIAKLDKEFPSDSEHDSKIDVFIQNKIKGDSK